jgi:uncharacterized protein YqeY
MALRERLTEAMKAAMKAKDSKRLATVRLMLADIQKQGIASKNENLPDEEMLAVLARMIKQREDSATAYDQGGRPELAAAERDEITVIREFMPKQMSEDEARAAIREAIAATGASSLKDMGKVMAALKEKHTGAMDFGRVSAMVKEQLSAPK